MVFFRSRTCVRYNSAKPAAKGPFNTASIMQSLYKNVQKPFNNNFLQGCGFGPCGNRISVKLETEQFVFFYLVIKNYRPYCCWWLRWARTNEIITTPQRLKFIFSDGFAWLFDLSENQWSLNMKWGMMGVEAPNPLRRELLDIFQRKIMPIFSDFSRPEI